MENVEVVYGGTGIAIVKLYDEHDVGDSAELRQLLEQQLGPNDLLIVDLPMRSSSTPRF